MIDFNFIKETVAGGMNDYLKKPVIPSNQIAKIPEYPFISYTVTTLQSENKGTYGEYEDGIDRKPVNQIWSLTSNSDDEDESIELAIKARDWLEHIGSTYLKDNGIIVQSVTSIQNRDNVLTTEYEYRNGFDVVFSLMNEIRNRTVETGEYIETLNIKREEE